LQGTHSYNKYLFYIYAQTRLFDSHVQEYPTKTKLQFAVSRRGPIV
jgi:hypothetical protein